MRRRAVTDSKIAIPPRRRPRTRRAKTATRSTSTRHTSCVCDERFVGERRRARRLLRRAVAALASSALAYVRPFACSHFYSHQLRRSVTNRAPRVVLRARLLDPRRLARSRKATTTCSARAPTMSSFPASPLVVASNSLKDTNKQKQESLMNGNSKSLNTLRRKCVAPKPTAC